MAPVVEQQRLLTEEEDDSSLSDEDTTTTASSDLRTISSASVKWDFDEAVQKVGFGPYQFILWFFLSLVSMSCGFNNMAMVFTGGNGGHVCKTPPNSTLADNSTTVQYFAGSCDYNRTVHYSNGTSLTHNHIKCHDWTYNRTVYNSTISYEWNLVCDKEYMVDLSSSIYYLGFFFGCLILGDLADRFGRRLLLLAPAVLTLSACVGAAYSPNYAVFTGLRFFVGVGVAGTRNSAYIMAAEFAKPRDRGTLGLISDMTYSVAYILTGVIFYLNPNWRMFQLYIALFHILFLVYVLFLPESPRWLMSKGRTEQAMKYFRTSSWVNRKHLPSDVTVVLKLPPQKSHSTLDLVRTPNLRKVGVVSLTLWFVVSLVYFGMSYNVSNLRGSIYVNNAILGGVELFANTVGIWIVKIGRRPAITVSFITASVAMLAICFAQSSYWGVIILAMIGKFIISPTFSYIYISTTELYPTQTRTLALGTGSAVARLGAAIAPFIPLSFSVWNKLPYIIFSAASGFAALVAMLLPETMDRPLPDSIASAEKMNVIHRNKFYSCCRKSDSLVHTPSLLHDGGESDEAVA